MLELPIRDPCDLCEGIAGREEKWEVIEESNHTLTVINPWQFEIGQCCVITRRHVATLLDRSDDECKSIIGAAKRAAHALVDSLKRLEVRRRLLTQSRHCVLHDLGSRQLKGKKNSRETIGNVEMQSLWGRRRIYGRHLFGLFDRTSD